MYVCNLSINIYSFLCIEPGLLFLFCHLLHSFVAGYGETALCHSARSVHSYQGDQEYARVPEI